MHFKKPCLGLRFFYRCRRLNEEVLEISRKDFSNAIFNAFKMSRKDFSKETNDAFQNVIVQPQGVSKKLVTVVEVVRILPGDLPWFLGAFCRNAFVVYYFTFTQVVSELYLSYIAG